VRKTALLLLPLVAVSVAATAARPKPRFSTPYDLVVTSRGELWIADGPSGRVLRYDLRRRRLAIAARIRGGELVGISHVGGASYVSDIRRGVVWRIGPKGRVSPFARVPAATDSVLTGRTLYVGSLEKGIFAIDLRTRRKRLLNRSLRPHGLTTDPGGRLVAVNPPHGIYRVDKRGGTTLLLGADGARAAFSRDGRLYFVQGSPEGATVRRLEADGSVTRVAGTGRIGPEGENVPATSVGLQISAILFARDGSLLLGQVAPRPAKIRRVDLGDARSRRSSEVPERGARRRPSRRAVTGFRVTRTRP
jgi:hypothetical protein